MHHAWNHNSRNENGVEINGVKDFLGISSRSMIHRGFSIAVSSRSGNFLTALAGSRCLLQAPTSCQSPMTCKNTPSPLLRHRAILSPCVWYQQKSRQCVSFLKNIATRFFISKKYRDKIFHFEKYRDNIFIIEKYRDKIVHFRKISRHGVDIRPTSAQPPAAWALLVWSSPGSLCHRGWLSKPGAQGG